MYVIDTCIINRISHGEVELEQLPSDGELVLSHVQIDELSNTRDDDIRARLFLTLAKIGPTVLPTESLVVGTSRWGEAKLSDGELYQSIKERLDERNGGKENNINDALIGEIALKKGYTLLTSDDDFRCVIAELGGSVTFWK